VTGAGMTGAGKTGAPFDLAAWLRQWRAWLEPVTDRLFDLDERVRAPDEQADLAAAFVGRKAIADRLDAVGAAMTADLATAADLARAPVEDDAGARVGADIEDAARLVDAVSAKVARAVASREGAEATDVGLRASLADDLVAVERTSSELGEGANQLADLRRQAASAGNLTAIVAAAARLRADLDARAAERVRLLQRWQGLGADLDALAGKETEVRALADRCREKILRPPPIAVPSVAVVEARRVDAADADQQPWRVARPVIGGLVGQVDQLAAALAEARRRFAAPLVRRDELRGLLQAFRSKAAAHGLGEHAQVEPGYRRAEATLWSAPCDIAAAEAEVAEFVELVNGLTTSGAASDLPPGARR
jgi:hypothetical protein